MRSVLGVGGVGEVLRALDQELGREGAIKCLNQRAAADPRAITRFTIETRTIARLQHPAIIPDGLVDAELFDNVRNYPNPGMAERVGVVGDSDGSSLFLDEFGELPVAVKAHLPRVLDSGEYRRLGEARPKRSDLRLIAATNRPDSVFKEDVLARFRVRVDVPDLNSRRGDVPLIARALRTRIAKQDPAMARRWFPDGDPNRAQWRHRSTLRTLRTLRPVPFSYPFRSLRPERVHLLLAGEADPPPHRPRHAASPTCAA